MEVAGLVLGGLPVAMMAVESSYNAAKLIGTYKDYQQTLQGIRRNIFIQEEQLQTTLKGIGLVKPTFQEVQERLREVKPDCHDQFVDILEHMDSITLRLLDKLDIDINGKPQWADMRIERVSWEWRRLKRTFGVKDRKELFDELQSWNTALRYCLEPKREIPSDHADPMTTKLIEVFNLKTCDEARTNFRIIHEALSVAWNDTCNAPEHPSNIEIIWQHRGLEKTGQLQLSVPELGSHQKSEHWQRIVINVDTNQANPTPTDSQSNSTSLGTRKWRPAFRPLSGMISPGSKFTKSSVAAQPPLQLDYLEPNDIIPTQSQLITELCSLTGEKNWSGYLLHRESTHKKMIYIKKDISPCPRFSILSLESVMSDYHYKSGKGKQVAYTRLSRKERLGIAAAAVWAALILCGTPWLEERPLGKQDINLLVDTPTQGRQFERPRAYPTLVYTFKSNKDTPNELPDIHQPDPYLRDQIRHKTLFTLGILLIELGLNKTLDQLRYDCQTNVPSCETSVLEDYKIANQVIESEELEREVCESYAHAVQRCIQCHFLGRESTQNFSHAAFRKQFFTGVVAPVQATFDAWSTTINSL